MTGVFAYGGLLKVPLISPHKNRTALDYILYVVAGAVIATLCFSALLWFTF